MPGGPQRRKGPTVLTDQALTWQDITPATETRPASSSGQMPLDLLPGQIRRGARPRTRLPCVVARCGALEHPLHDALADAGDTEHVVGHAEFPHLRLDGAAAGARAVALDVLLLARDTERRQVEPLQPPDLPLPRPPQHDVIGEVGERVTERGELPV